MNSSVVLFLPINKTWSSSGDPCTRYRCIGLSDGETRIDVKTVDCETSCADDFTYKAIPNECCGKCVASFCTIGDKTFKVGEIWKSANNCTVNECIDTGSELIVSSYKKSCPKLKNCPEDNVELRDCCPYCNNRNQRE